jgi:hypothetical protein
MTTREGHVIDDRTVVRRNTKVEARGLGDEGGAVLLHVGTGAYHGTNDVGALIWETLEEPKTFEDLLRALRSTLLDPPAELPAEVSTFLTDLADRDLVVLEPASPG